MEGYYVIKKDGTREAFDVSKVTKAVNKSAYRAMVEFTESDLNFISGFVEAKVRSRTTKEVPISEMHNIVESALEEVKPVVAKPLFHLIISCKKLKKEDIKNAIWFTLMNH